MLTQNLQDNELDLEDTVESIFSVQGNFAASKGVRRVVVVSPDLPSCVVGDKRYVYKILFNVLHNAIKFTAQGGVDLRVGWVGERLRFEVEDTGRGIAPDRQAHIFHRFEHADVQTNRADGGTGLGLTLSPTALAKYGQRLV